MTQMVDVNEYLANVAQVARKCPTTTLRHAYMRAFREWCQQTQWLRTNVPGVTVAGQRQYNLGNDPDLDIMGIFAMQGSQTPAQNANAVNTQFWRIAPSDSTFWNENLSAGQPLRYAYIPEAQFALDPIPQQAYNLQVTVILAPDEASVNVPLAPLVKYSNDIEAGALEYLLMLPGMPWTDKPMSAAMGAKFRSGISNGKAEAQRMYNVGAQRMRPRPFGGGFGRPGSGAYGYGYGSGWGPY
jgi:hypothetical protein